MVVHGLDGVDEISTVGKTLIAHLKNGKVTAAEFTPQSFGLKPARPTDLYAATSEESAETIIRILHGRDGGAKAHIVLVNAAAGIIVGGKADTFEEGLALARESIASGAAYGKLKALVEASGGNIEKLEEQE
jgi:anthranilate phosphoribosyltransferase